MRGESEVLRETLRESGEGNRRDVISIDDDDDGGDDGDGDGGEIEERKG